MAKKFRIKKIVKHAVREYITIVDDQDAHLLRTSFWTILHSGSEKNTAYVGKTTRMETVLLHRVIMGAKPRQIVWHINGDMLDNRRENLLLRGAPDEVTEE